MSHAISKFFEDPFDGLNPWSDKPTIWNKPAQMWADQVDTYAVKDSPKWAQPYVAPALNLGLSAINPFLGAASSTLLSEGQREQNGQKGINWGSLGKDAAMNFGTAALSVGANKLLQNADSGVKAAKDASTLSNFNAGTNLASGTNSAYSATALNAANNAAKVANGALDSFVPAMSSVGGGFANVAGQALTPTMTSIDGGRTSSPLSYYANQVQTTGPGLLDNAYKGAITGGKELASNALTSTLAPNTKPISGVSDTASISSNSTVPQMQYGDLLNAFGGPEGNTPNPNGYRYDENAVKGMTERLASNNFLQQQQARDTALPAGQRTPQENSPYANRLNNIQQGTNQSYTDLMSQVDNANQYYGYVDSNPGLTSDMLDTYLRNPDSIDQVQNNNKYYSTIQNNSGLTAADLDAYLANPSSGVMGQFSVSPESAAQFAGLTTPKLPNNFFTAGTMLPVPQDRSALAGIRPLGPMNTSLL